MVSAFDRRCAVPPLQSSLATPVGSFGLVPPSPEYGNAMIDAFEHMAWAWHVDGQSEREILRQLDELDRIAGRQPVMYRHLHPSPDWQWVAHELAYALQWHQRHGGWARYVNSVPPPRRPERDRRRVA
jgi:hypothetical protein